MYILYECAACALAALVGATLLFTVCITFLALFEGGNILANRSRRLTLSAAPLKGSWMGIESRNSQL